MAEPQEESSLPKPATNLTSNKMLLVTERWVMGNTTQPFVGPKPGVGNQLFNSCAAAPWD